MRAHAGISIPIETSTQSRPPVSLAFVPIHFKIMSAI